MSRVSRLSGIFRDLPVHLRRLGPAYVGYLLFGIVVPWLTYWVLYGAHGDRVRFGILVGDGEPDDGTLERLPGRRLRRVIGLGVILGFAIAFLVVGHSYGVLRAVLVTLALGLAGTVATLSIWVLQLAQMRRQAGALLEAARLAYSSDTFSSWADLRVDPETRRAVEAAMRDSASEELVIGRIDGMGRLQGVFGELGGMKPVAQAEFVDRSDSEFDVVLTGGQVLVRERFKDSGTRFVRQWYHLAALHARANVPAIHHVDEERSRIYSSFVPGRSLSALCGNEGVDGAMSDEFWAEAEDQLDRIHASGIAGLELDGAGVVVGPDGLPWFTGFRDADTYRSTSGVAFAVRRDQDRVRFNRLFRRSLLTERSARSALVAQVGSSVEQRNWYSTIDFGRGLVVGPVWITSHGPGRWRFLNHDVVAPLVRGRRVLDLGCNNGVLPMMMMRDGAAEVVGVELSVPNVRSARLVREVFEWRDVRKYDFTVHQSNMLEVLRRDWGVFDVVTAFCSLYYLEADDMSKIVQRCAELAPTMILQANNLSKPPGRRERASLEFLRRLLEDNGFPVVEVYAPSGYSRPIVVGRVAATPLS